MKKVDIRLLQEAQATIENLQAKLSGESFVSHEHYAALNKERDELAARVVELEEALEKSLWGKPVRCADEILARTPAASLAELTRSVYNDIFNKLECCKCRNITKALLEKSSID